MTHRLFSNQKKWTIKSLVIASVFAIIPASTSFAASDFTAANVAGSKAILFSFSGLSVLAANAYDVKDVGAGIGAKYYLTDPLALRASLIFATASQNVPAQASPGTDGSNSGTMFGLTAGAEYHLLKGRVSPFVGGALGFSTTSTTKKSMVAGTGPQTTIENDATTPPLSLGGYTFTPGLAFQVAGIGGIEFFITQDISLGAEYQLGLFMNSPSDTKATTPPNTVTAKNGATTAFGIHGAGMLTLAVYF
jgi:hypothetical protein